MPPLQHVELDQMTAEEVRIGRAVHETKIRSFPTSGASTTGSSQRAPPVGLVGLACKASRLQADDRVAIDSVPR